MSTTIQLPIPIFESGLPLSVADLNNMFNYADEGERHTRICLIGAGIVYGLKVSVDTGLNISISAGAGVTSQGYLYCQEKLKTFSKFKSVGATIETSNYSSANLTNTNVWMDGDVATRNKKPEDPTPFNFSGVAELVADGGKTIDSKALNNRVLVIVFERVSVKRNGCTTCNKGSNGQVYTRFLLLKKAEWDRLSKCDLLNMQSNQGTFQYPYLQRFGLVDNCADFFIYDSSTALNGQYQKVVSAAVETLMPGLIDMVDAFAPMLKRNKAEDKVIISNGVSTALHTKASKQYSYDYIKHIIQAYSELTENPLVQSIAQLPPESCFPKYLTLAHFVSRDVTTNSIAQIEMQTEGVRLPFFTPPFEEASRTFQEAKFLYERIIAMLSPENLLFERGSTQENDPSDIKITPSRVTYDPLSNRAIPYYFDGAKMRSAWHFQRTKTNRIKRVFAYDREANRPFDEPLLYQNAFDNADFYRIEGHINKTLGVVWNKLVGDTRQQSIGLRTCLNLPFSVEIVEVAPHTEGSKTVFTRLEQFASKHSGLEHQGGVMRGGTLILVVERPSIQIVETDVNTRGLTREQEPFVGLNNETYKVVADFCLPYWVAEEPRQMALAYFTLENVVEDSTKGFKQVDFINKSPINQIFEWFINDVSVATSRDLLTKTFQFEANDKTSTERTFVVTLVAKLNAADELPDMSTQGVTITREVKEKVEPPVADFQEIKRVKTSNQQEQQGELITFENRSNHAVSYVWEVSEIGTQGALTKLSVQQPANPKDNFAHLFTFNTSAGNETKKFKVVLKAQSPNATPNVDIAEQEVLITRTVVVEVVQPVANFTITKSIDAKINPQTGFKDVEVFSFNNTSSKAKSYEWFIDNTFIPISEYTDGKHLLNRPFPFGGNDIFERDFVVTLIAYSEEQQKGEQDVEKLTVSIRREIKADFNFVKAMNLSFDAQGNFTKTITANEPVFSATFRNLSENGIKYQWSVFVNGDLVTDTQGRGRLETSKWLEPFAFDFTVRVNDGDKEQNETTYLIQLIAFDAANIVAATSEKRLRIVAPPRANQPKPSVVSEALSATRGIGEVNEDTPTVDGLAASRNMAARRRNFIKTIEDTGSENPSLSSKKSFQNVVDFMATLDKAVADYDRVSSLEKNFDALENFDKTFRVNAFQLIQNIKKTGGVSDDAYRNVLRNYLFFYLDKLVHLLPDELTPTTEQTVRDVLTKIKEEQSFPTETLDDLRQTWQVADITMMQNVPVVQQLNGLFV